MTKVKWIGLASVFGIVGFVLITGTKNPDSGVATAGAAPTPAAFPQYDCDVMVQHYWNYNGVVQQYKDKISQTDLDVAKIETWKHIKLNQAKEYLAHPECTKDADFMRKMVAE
jgi:hypothetical protein